MALLRFVYAVCDSCGEPCEGGGPDAREARWQARRRGWTRRDGRDLCRTCWKKGGR
jgi:hypothetical protein